MILYIQRTVETKVLKLLMTQPERDPWSDFPSITVSGIHRDFKR